MTRVAIAFVGCKVSQADGEQALGELTAAGMLPVRTRDGADLVVVHTCCVTAEAERKSRRLVRRMAGDGTRVIVAGCAAALNPGQFDGPGVEVTARPDWAALAAASAAAGSPPEDTAPPHAAAPRARTRFVLKVQDGCAGICSYCVVRLVRGRPRSTSRRDALAAARAALARGCGEIVLSGIDLGAWQDGELRLPDLVVALADLPGLARLRLSSLEPRHLDKRLLEALAHPRVARHLHVPLQSADDAVLAAMRRPATFAQYSAAAERMQAHLGDCMLSTDVIVGFPTEDDAAFERTLAALAERPVRARARVRLLAAAGDGGSGAAAPAGRGRQGAHEARAGGRRGGRPVRAPRRAGARRGGPRRGAARRALEGVQFAVHPLLRRGSGAPGQPCPRWSPSKSTRME